MGLDDGVDIHLDDSGQPRIIERSYVVEEELAGLRLDQFLVKKIPRMSRSKLQKVIKGHIRRSPGKPTRANARVFAGETITFLVQARPEPPCPRRFDICFEDEDLMVLNKPAGLPVHATAKFYFNTLTRVLLERYGEPPPQICHRLDRETSGCLVVAKSKEMASVLKQSFEFKKNEKTYLAIVHGAVLCIVVNLLLSWIMYG